MILDFSFFSKIREASTWVQILYLTPIIWHPPRSPHCEPRHSPPLTQYACASPSGLILVIPSARLPKAWTPFSSVTYLKSYFSDSHGRSVSNKAPAEDGPAGLLWLRCLFFPKATHEASKKQTDLPFCSVPSTLRWTLCMWVYRIPLGHICQSPKSSRSMDGPMHPSALSPHIRWGIHIHSKWVLFRTVPNT